MENVENKTVTGNNGVPPVETNNNIIVQSNENKTKI